MTPEVAQTHFNDRDGAIPVDFRDPKTKLFDMKVYDRAGPEPEQPLDDRVPRGAGARAPRREDARRRSATPVRVSEPEAWEEYQRRYSTATLT